MEVYDQLADLFLNPPRRLAKNVIAIEDLMKLNSYMVTKMRQVYFHNIDFGTCMV